MENIERIKSEAELISEGQRLQQEDIENHLRLAQIARLRAQNARLQGKEDVAVKFDAQANMYENAASAIKDEEL